MNRSVFSVDLFRNRERLAATIAVVVMIALGVVFLYPVVFEAKTFYAFDILRQYLPWSADAPADFRPHNPLITDPVNVMYPYFLLFKDSIALKTVRFWNGSTFCGLPVLPVLHPGQFLAYLLFPASIAHDVVLGIHLVLTGLFMFLFLRRRDLKPAAALLGGVAWMFNAYLMVWFEFENVILLAPCLAATLYFLECRLQSARVRYTLGLAAALTVGLSTNYAHLMIYQLLFTAAYGVHRCLSLQMQGKTIAPDAGRQLIPGSLALALVTAMGTAVVLGHQSIAETAQRDLFPFSELGLRTGQLPFKYLITLLFPDFYGNPTGPVSFIPRIAGAQPYNNYNELCIYTGIVTLFFAMAAATACRRRAGIAFFLICAVVTAAMAMGSILYYPLARWIPGLSLSTPTRILYLFGFSLAVLSAFGADILLAKHCEQPTLRRVGWCLLLLIMLGTAIAVQSENIIQRIAGIGDASQWHQWRQVLVDRFRWSSETVAKPLALGFTTWALLMLMSLEWVGRGLKSAVFGLLMLLLCYDLMSFGRNYNTVVPRATVYPATPAIAFLKQDPTRFRVLATDHFLPNGFAPFKIQDAGGYASFYPRRYAQYFHLSQQEKPAPLPQAFSRWTSFSRFGSPLLNLINVKYFLVPSNWTTDAASVKLVYDKEVRIYENLEAFPRIFFVPRYEFSPSPEVTLQKLSTFSNADFRTKVILESPPPGDWAAGLSAFPETEARIDVIAYAADKVEIELAVPSAGFLVVADSYHPDWHARRNGKEVPVMRANAVMRALPITAGRHHIMLDYKPTRARSAVVLAVIVWSVFCFWTGGLFFISLRHRRIRRPPARNTYSAPTD